MMFLTMMMFGENDIILSRKIGLHKVKEIATWAAESDRNKELLWKMSFSDDRRTSVNCLWILTHFELSDSIWLKDLQSQIIIRLLSEQDPTKKRIYLQLLKKQDFDPDLPIVIKLLDFCLSKINSECETYAIRCFSIYVAFRICHSYPELITELEEHLNLLSMQQISPGLKSALRQTRERILKLRTSTKIIP